MALVDGPPAEVEPAVLQPFNPLQTYHSHLYSSSSKQRRLQNAGNVNTERSWRRSSRHDVSAVETESNNVKKRTSRLGFFSLFNRNTKPDIEILQPNLETQWEGDECEAPASTIAIESSCPVSRSYVPDESLEAASQAPQHEPIRHRASKRALKTKDSFTRQKTTRWEPPPLFQAYPQSIKYATLDSPTLPADTIVRLNQERQSSSAKQENLSDVLESGQRLKDKKLRKASAPELVSNRDWTQKIYVLVTEGYFLQYAGRGNYDRAPERILPLNKDSAAFASDAIPGKPFVLQVSQISSEDGTVNLEISKDVLRKAGLRIESKRSASTFLLILNSPEDMNAWLVAVRKEIEALGGKQHRPEIFGTDGMAGGMGDALGLDIHRIPSQRYLVKREPHRFSHKSPEPSPPAILNEHIPEETRSPTINAAIPCNRYSMATQDSTGSPYVSGRAASIDQIHLDRLRQSPRQSYASTGAKTASTSRCSSMERSPIAERFNETLEAKASSRRASENALHPIPIYQRPPETIDRDVEQATPTPSSETRSSVITQTPMRAVSPATPNFSVPTFSKRYSVASNSSIPSIKAQTPPTIVRSDNSKSSTEDVGRGRERDSFVGEMQYRPPSSSRASKRTSLATQSSARLSTPPKSSDSKRLPSSADGEPHYSRRHSSLNYARGISPIQLPNHSPSPHPPPTTALPPLPSPSNLNRLSLVPPPTGPLPPVPVNGQRASSVPPSRHAPLPTAAEPFPPAALLSPPSHPPPMEASTPRKLRRPVSMQVRPRPPTPPSHHCVPSIQESKVDIPFPNKPVEQTYSPPKPSRPPPPPPVELSSSPPKTLARKSMPRIGQPAPPLAPPTITPATVSIVPSTNGRSGEVAPHPFIPPIKISDRRSGGSLDGPWNLDYGAPTRAFLDLTTG